MVTSSREVDLDNFGLMVITDELTILNNDTHMVTSFKYYIPKPLADYCTEFYAFDDIGPLSYDFEEYQNYTMYEIYLNKYLKPGDDCTIRIKTVYRPKYIVIYGNMTLGSITFNISTYPMLPYLIKRATFKFHDVEETYNDVSPFNITYREVSLPAHTVRLCEANVSSEIIIREIGLITVKSTIKVENYGPADVSELYVYIDRNSRDVEVRDIVGKLKIDKEETSSGIKVTVKIEESRYAIPENSSYEFIISYTIPVDEYLRSINNLYRLSMPLIVNTSMAIVALDLKFKFPDGTAHSIVRLHNRALTIEKSGGSEVKITLMNFTCIHDPIYADINFYMYLLIPFRPYIFSIVIASLLAIYVISRRYAVKVVPPALIPIEMIDDLNKYCDLVEERLATHMEIDNLDKSFVERRIKRKRYRERRATLENRISSINDKLKKLETRLKAAPKRVRDLITEMEILETERETLKASLHRLQRHFLEGKVTRDIFFKLQSENEKRLRRIYARMDQILKELRDMMKGAPAESK
ncbi:MAG: hypothetical protein ACTSXJ_01785 [Candidatus Baldrarchaeia archaeon]